VVDPAVQEFAKLNDVDRNIIHNLQRRIVNLITEDPEYDASKFEGLGFKEEAATGGTNK
jgi:hypothetical protein